MKQSVLAGETKCFNSMKQNVPAGETNQTKGRLPESCRNAAEKDSPKLLKTTLSSTGEGLQTIIRYQACRNHSCRIGHKIPPIASPILRTKLLQQLDTPAEKQRTKTGSYPCMPNGSTVAAMLQEKLHPQRAGHTEIHAEVHKLVESRRRIEAGFGRIEKRQKDYQQNDKKGYRIFLDIIEHNYRVL